MQSLLFFFSSDALSSRCEARAKRSKKALRGMRNTVDEEGTGAEKQNEAV